MISLKSIELNIYYRRWDHFPITGNRNCNSHPLVLFDLGFWPSRLGVECRTKILKCDESKNQALGTVLMAIKTEKGKQKIKERNMEYKNFI